MASPPTVAFRAEQMSHPTDPALEGGASIAAQNKPLQMTVAAPVTIFIISIFVLLSASHIGGA